jgi:hypothetical protein
MANPSQPPPSAPVKAQPRGRGGSRYRKTETKRLLKGAAEAGLVVRSFEVDPVTGVLRVFVGKPGEPGPAANPWDEVLTDAANQKRPA